MCTSPITARSKLSSTTVSETTMQMKNTSTNVPSSSAT